MFSLRRRISSEPLMNSTLYDERAFYRALMYDLKRAEQSVIIESPCMTCRRVSEILPVLIKLRKRGVVIRINTRNPNHHDAVLRMQGWKSFYLLKDHGIKVKICNDMRHRKLAMIDETILWEGSLNILSQSRSREIMRRTVSPDLCQQMIHFTGVNRRFW